MSFSKSMYAIRDNSSNLLPLQYMKVKVKFTLKKATKAQRGEEL